jgi:hypothetical protein
MVFFIKLIINGSVDFIYILLQYLNNHSHKIFKIIDKIVAVTPKNKIKK